MRVLILCGGKSPEHEISIRSAYNIAANLDSNSFDIIIIGMSRSGKMYRLSEDNLNALSEVLGFVGDDLYPEVHIELGHVVCGHEKYKIDVCFPIVHGVGGEDGVLQGMLEHNDLPYVGSDVKSSALCMDKDAAKRILASYGIPVVPFVTLRSGDDYSYDEVSKKLGTTLFIKAAAQGSSLGTYKARNRSEFNSSVRAAFEYGPKIVVEKAIMGREIECAVMGNSSPKVSPILGEIVPRGEFYDYDSKYIDPDGAALVVGADLGVHEEVKSIALKAFRVLDCLGLARIDFFVENNETIYLNEINTLPGFTNISMYPKMFMESGMTYKQILKELIRLAVEHHTLKKSYKITKE